MTNTLSALEQVSRNPKKLLATGIARTVDSLGHDITLLREKILGLIAGRVVLTTQELTLIQDALTSQKGGAVMDLVNHRLFCDFMDERARQDEELAQMISSGVEEFQV